MIAVLDSIGPAVLRATLEASVLALVVAIVIKLLGDRLRAEWRFLLWGVVLARLLIIVTPASSWSIFNLARWERTQATQLANGRQNVSNIADIPLQMTKQQRLSHESMDRAEPAAQMPTVVNNSAPIFNPLATPLAASEPTARKPIWPALPWTQVFVSVWLIGCAAFALRLTALAISLRRRLAAARIVSDADVLELFETVRQRFGVRKLPELLVSPEPISPFLVGTLRPRIVVPESLLTESSHARLRHVLAHELAHLVRHDLWTNWLLLAARTLHWSNPIAWWTVYEMRSEREAACDELALSALGEADRTVYATTMIELAASLAPSTIAPGMIGLFSSTRRLQSRIERVLRSPSIKKLRASVCTGLLLVIALFGLTDASPAHASKTPEAGEQPAQHTAPGAFSISGECRDEKDKAILPGIRVQLFKIEGMVRSPVKIAETTSDQAGRFEFKGLAPPRPLPARRDRLTYQVFGVGKNRPYRFGLLMTNNAMPSLLPTEIALLHPIRDRRNVSVVLDMPRGETSMTGKVVNEYGKPVSGAVVTEYSTEGRGFPGVLTATTDRDGRFTIEKLPVLPGALVAGGYGIWVKHPDYPEAFVNVHAPFNDGVVKLQPGCTITGAVVDQVTDHPAGNVLVIAENIDTAGEAFAMTDAAGDYRLVVADGSYNITMDATDRVCVAPASQVFATGKHVELPPLKLIRGGFIAGHVIDTGTLQPVATTGNEKMQIMLGLYGSAQPPGRRIAFTTPLTAVDASGRFVMRAAPGENFPYFANAFGDRMTWNTRKQPPVVVNDGQTTTCDMLTTPQTPEKQPAEQLAAAKKIVAALPADPRERTAQIILNLRKLDRSVDNADSWAMLIRELVKIGPAAVPQLCTELDRTSSSGMLRLLGFSLRAIGDPRAVPALIRAIPKTLLPASSDYGVKVDDPELQKFMQANDLHTGHMPMKLFDFGRPPREIFGALHKLTKQNFGDSQIYSVMLASDPHRAALQRRLYQRQAELWESWWKSHWKQFKVDPADSEVNLKPLTENLPPATTKLGPHAEVSGEGSEGEVLAPPGEGGRNGPHFLDLDTGYQPHWPKNIPFDEAKLDKNELADWARREGVDLMCVTVRSPGKRVYVLKGFDLKASEISQEDFRKIDKFVEAGKLPEGRPVGDLLVHCNADSKQDEPGANAMFICRTREGGIFLLETTDQITRAVDITGRLSVPKGIGFRKGVKFNWQAINP